MAAALAPPPFREVERLVWRTPFGLKLWDAAERRIVADGLHIRLFQRRRPADPALVLRPNGGDIFVAHRLPGMMAMPASGSPPETRSFRLVVRDPAGRFQRFALDLDLPAPDGLVGLPCAAAVGEPRAPAGSPPAIPPAEPTVPLLSAPARPVPAALASLRAELLDADTGLPAAFAVLEIRHAGALLARAMTGADGALLAVFPYPEAGPAAAPPGSPPGPGGLLQRTWRLDLAVRYGPVAGMPAPAPGEPSYPELCQALTQPPARLFAGAASPPMSVTTATLAYGRELNLGPGAGTPALLVAPGSA